MDLHLHHTVFREVLALLLGTPLISRYTLPAARRKTEASPAIRTPFPPAPVDSVDTLSLPRIPTRFHSLLLTVCTLFRLGITTDLDSPRRLPRRTLVRCIPLTVGILLCSSETLSEDMLHYFLDMSHSSDTLLTTRHISSYLAETVLRDSLRLHLNMLRLFGMLRPMHHISSHSVEIHQEDRWNCFPCM